MARKEGDQQRRPNESHQEVGLQQAHCADMVVDEERICAPVGEAANQPFTKKIEPMAISTPP